MDKNKSHLTLKDIELLEVCVNKIDEPIPLSWWNELSSLIEKTSSSLNADHFEPTHKEKFLKIKEQVSESDMEELKLSIKNSESLKI